jgi:DNA-binding response OmpR family regulator
MTLYSSVRSTGIKMKSMMIKSGPLDPELFAEHHPPIICLDVCMPDLQGIEVCQCIRNLDEQAWILLMTGLALGPDKRCAAYRLGADDYLQRPFGMQEFVVRVNVGARRIKASIRAPAALDNVCGEGYVYHRNTLIH